METGKGAALQAGIIWQFYGEQSTFWFYLARERQGRTELLALRTGPAPDSPRVVLGVLDHPAGRDRGGAVLREYYSGDAAAGLFAAQPVSLAAQDELLQAVDSVCPLRQLQRQKESAVTAACRSQSWRLPSGAYRAARHRAWMACHMSSTCASGLW